MTKILNSALGQQIVDAVREVVDQDINFINADGIIIASTDAKRVGGFHEAGYEVAHKRKMIIVSEDEAFEGAKTGVNYPIIIEGQVMGVIGITGEPRKIMKYGFLASKITEIFIKEAQLMGSYESRKTMIGYFMNLCIYEKAVKAQVIKDMMIKLHIKESVSYQCVIVEIPKNNVEYIQIEKQVHHLLSHYNIELYMYQYPNRFILVIPRDRVRELKSLIKDLEGEEESYIFCGIGSRGSIQEIRASYEMALIALKHGKLMGSMVVDSSDLDMEILFERLPDHVKDKYIQKVVGKLTEEEIKLLEKYYTCNMSLKLTADDLYIHKNTVQYRLDKIYEKTGLNPREFKDSARLYVGIYLYNQL